MKIKIKPEFKCETFYKEINFILGCILSVRDSGQEVEGGRLYDLDTHLDMKSLKQVLVTILYEKTNLADVLNSNKYHLEVSSIDKTFNGLDPTSKDLFKQFLLNLENLVVNTKNDSFFYLLPSNLKVEDSIDFNTLDNLLKLFNLKRIDFDEIIQILDLVDYGPNNTKSNSSDSYLLHKSRELTEPPKEDILNYLEDYGLFLVLEIEAKNLGYSNSFARFKFESFLGLLSFAEYISLIKIFPFESNLFNEISYGEMVIVVNNRAVWPQKYMFSSLKEKPKKHMTFKSNKNLQTLYDNIKRINNKSLWKLLEKLFFLYYKASKEEKNEYAFLNYWIIAETIIKADNKAKSNEEMKSIMKSVIGEKIIKKRVDFLDKKRNFVVHRGVTVTVDERDLMKRISEQLLLIAVFEMGNLKNKKQFGYYISNFRKKNKDRNDNIEVLKLLNSENDF